MNLIVMIPAYNEEDSIGNVINGIKKTLDEFIKTRQILKNYGILVIDDGSEDGTAKIAEELGAMVIQHPQNMGLGIAFRNGLKECLRLGADIIVNIDADGQYLPEEIPDLISPILEKRADMVIGTRFEHLNYRMPALKRYGNKFMTALIRRITGLDIKDAQSGFRAFTYDCARTLQIYLQGRYTYTQESIIHARFHDFRIEQIPVQFNARTHGSSRLIKNIYSYFTNASRILIKTYKYYKPMHFFGYIGILLMLIGIIALLLDHYKLLQGTHIIPGLDITNDPKIIITILIPLIMAILFLIFGVILDTINKSRMSTIKANIQLKEELKEIKEQLQKLEKQKEKE